MITNDATVQMICEGEQPFRPSDWAVRLAGLDAEFGPDQRLRYSRYLRPANKDNKRCVCIDPDTARQRPELHQEVMNFARQHGLVVVA